MQFEIGAPFIHPKNIVFGYGRVIYVDGHGIEPSGWRLPGGRFTQNPDEAERVARAIDELTMDLMAHYGAAPERA